MIFLSSTLMLFQSKSYNILNDVLIMTNVCVVFFLMWFLCSSILVFVFVQHIKLCNLNNFMTLEREELGKIFFVYFDKSIQFIDIRKG